MLFNKKFVDICQILTQFKKHFEIKFLKFLLESDNFLLKTVFGQSRNVGVNYLASDSSSTEACREVSVASLERLFRGVLKGSHYSFELDLSLCIWPLCSSVQRISVPLRIFVIYLRI